MQRPSRADFFVTLLLGSSAAVVSRAVVRSKLSGPHRLARELDGCAARSHCPGLSLKYRPRNPSRAVCADSHEAAQCVVMASLWHKHWAWVGQPRCRPALVRSIATRWRGRTTVLLTRGLRTVPRHVTRTPHNLTVLCTSFPSRSCYMSLKLDTLFGPKAALFGCVVGLHKSSQSHTHCSPPTARASLVTFHLFR